MQKKTINGRLEFYYITHINNLPSIFEKGLLSHYRVQKLGIPHETIANEEIIEKRKAKGLEDYVNLYINPRNAMMYSKSKGANLQNNLAIIGISGEVLKEAEDLKISIGNAASDYSIILPKQQLRNIHLPKLFKKIRSIRTWVSDKYTPFEEQIDVSEFFKTPQPSKFLSLKVFLQSEVLIRGKIPPKFFKVIYVPNHETKERIKNLVPNLEVPIVNSPDYFFSIVRREQILENIWIVQGDMFNSDFELLTISVNTVGVMGKGLASRFKYMYPAVYVIYQNLCKEKKLKVGQPFIVDTPELERKFLLFPTKKHWRENSKIEYISKGLDWFLNNYERYQIKSAAFPALGCGLGKLKWEQVGPLMVSKLSKAKIPIEIYLPEERKPLEKYFHKEFYFKV